MALVVRTDKVAIQKQIVHPRRKWETASGTVFGGESAISWLDGEVDGGVKRGDTSDALRTEMCANDEGEVAACRKATKGDAAGIIDVRLRENVVDDVLSIVTWSRERMFGSLAVVGIHDDTVGTERLEEVYNKCMIIAEVGQNKSRSVPGYMDGKRSGDAIRRRSHMFGTVDVGFYGSTALSRRKLDNVTFECMGQRRLVSVDQWTKRIQETHEHDQGL